MAASDQQVQKFVNERIRVRAEQIRALQANLNDDISAIDDVYNALSQQDPTWLDTRPDGPPHLLTPSDVLAINAMFHDLQTAISSNPNLPTVLKACVQPLGA